MGFRQRMLEAFRARGAEPPVPDELTATAPHLRHTWNLRAHMLIVLLVVLPSAAVGIHLYGPRVLTMLAVSWACGGMVSLVFARFRRQQLDEGFLLTGLLFVLILPPVIPLWMVGLGAAFGIFFGAQVFGGTGHNLFNPVAVGRCFLDLGYPLAMTKALAATGSAPGVAANVSIMTRFWGPMPGWVGAGSAAAILLGGLILVATKVASWRTMVATIGSAAALAGILWIGKGSEVDPPLVALLSGGFLFGACFLATDPVTSPGTNVGKWIYGALIGLLSVVIRNFSVRTEGVVYAILLGNVFAPVIDRAVLSLKFRRSGT